MEDFLNRQSLQLIEATTRFELVMTVLQTGALPLGYVAIFNSNAYIISIYIIFVKDFFILPKSFFVFLDILQKLHYNITIIDKTQNTVRAYCTHYHFTCMCSAHKCYKQA